MIPQDLTYDFPQAAFLLFALFPILGLSWWLYDKRSQALKTLGEPDILLQTIVPRSRIAFWSKVVALCFVWIFSVIALMQPKGNAHYPEENLRIPKLHKGVQEQEVRRRAHEVIILVDASASMAVQDTRLKESRFDYAKEIADLIVSRLNGETVSLYAFTSEVTQLAPSTTDYLYVRLMLRQIRINEGDATGTSLFNVLAEMRDRYFKTSTPKLKTLILLSDGGDTRLEALTDGKRDQEIDNLLTFLGNPAALNLRVYTIGLGSKEGGTVPQLTYEGKSVHSVLQDDVLRKLAQRGRGDYFRANDYTALTIAQDIMKGMQQDTPYLEEATVLKPLGAMEGSNKVYDLYYQVPLLLALLFLAYLLVWPEGKEDVHAL